MSATLLAGCLAGHSQITLSAGDRCVYEFSTLSPAFELPFGAPLDLGAPNHGVLSQMFIQHPQERSTADSPRLHQADHHPDILDRRQVPLGGAALGGRCSGPLAGGLGSAVFAGPALIEPALDAFALGVAVIGSTALRGSPLAVSFPATKRVTQILASGIARMRQEENAAVPASDQAGAQVRLSTPFLKCTHLSAAAA
jgi:hypothetical protein